MKDCLLLSILKTLILNGLICSGDKLNQYAYTVELIRLCTGICYDCHLPLRLVSPMHTYGNRVGRLTTIHSQGSHWASAGLEYLTLTCLEEIPLIQALCRTPLTLGLFQVLYQLCSFLLFSSLPSPPSPWLAVTQAHPFSSMLGKQTPRKAAWCFMREL